MKIPVINKSGTPSGFYQDANGRWHRPNGDFASNAEVGIASPAKTATGSHGNSLSDPRTNYGYEKYVEASMDEKKSMIVKNVVDSVKAIKTKGKIDFNHFKEDMMSFCEISGINYY